MVPHSDIAASLDICSPARLFAAYHGLSSGSRLPRHPPFPLSCLTFSSYISVIRLGLFGFWFLCLFLLSRHSADDGLDSLKFPCIEFSPVISSSSRPLSVSDIFLISGIRFTRYVSLTGYLQPLPSPIARLRALVPSAAYA